MIKVKEEASTTAALTSGDFCLMEAELGKRKEKQRELQQGSAEAPGATSQRVGCSGLVAALSQWGVCSGQGAQVF